MAIYLLDSFSHYQSSDLLRKWTTIPESGLGERLILPGFGRCLQSAFRLRQVNIGGGQGPLFHVPLPNLTEGVLGTGFSFNNAGGPWSLIFGLFNGGGLDVDRTLSLALKSNGTLGLFRGNFNPGSPVEIATSLNAINDSSWHSYAWTFKTDGAVGTSAVYVDGDLGNPWFTFTGNTGANNYTDFQLGYAQGGTGGPQYYSDFYYGTLRSDLKGDCRVFARLPNREGPFLQWTPSTGAIHYQMVDENPPNDDVDYNFDQTAGHEDLYGFPAIGIASGTVYAVQTCLLMKKTDVGFRSVAPVINVGGVDYLGATRAIADGSWLYYMQCWDQNDPSGAAWTVPNAVNSYYGQRTIA